MGIYDREYYRDETRGSGWLSGAAPACKSIIAINVVCFVFQKLFYPDFNHWFQNNASLVLHDFQVWRLLTCAFLHGDPWHILFNMLFLWMVGREMEAFYGKWDFVALYVSAAIVSSLVWVIFDRYDGTPGNNAIGASGAVMAVIVLYTLYYPRQRILVMFIFPVEMWLFLVIYLGYNFIQMFAPVRGDNVGYSAHIGGAVYGYLYKVGDLRLSRFQKMLKRRPRLRIVSGEPRETSSSPRPSMGPTWSSSTAASARPSSTAIITEEQFDEKFDQILVKIAREGRGNLTDDENRILEEASRRARNRRSERI